MVEKLYGGETTSASSSSIGNKHEFNLIECSLLISKLVTFQSVV